MGEATEQRNAEAEKNRQTIADAQGGQAGVEKAIAILKEFYSNNQSTTTGLVQETPMPEFDLSGENTQHQAGSNVINMLSILLSDFAKLEAETQADESQAAQEFKKFMNESKQNKAVKERDNEMQKSERDEQANNEQEAKDELENTMAENKAALAVYEKLKKKCVDTGLSYEDRVQKRQEEIQSLKEGLQILEDAA